jgi:subtilisin-like proprotein convertase family protein
MPISNSTPSDAVFADQWHLRNTASGQYDLNVMQAWAAGFTGAGVRVFVLDDGFDTGHSDIAPNYNPSGQIDYEQGDSSPVPRFPADSHGTACMGIIGAARNGSGAVGVAYGADLTGIRGYSDDQQSGGSFDDYVTDLGRGILRAATQGGDVISMSNGYAAGDAWFGNGLTASAVDGCVADIREAIESGRDGLGLIMVKAAGNSRSENWNTNMSEVDNDPHLISVAAVDRSGNVDDYSSYGGNILVAGFGSPGEVVTTDRRGSDGYDAGNFTYGFNGTSAATPMVAGVVALILDANAGLGWRDVQDILAATARVVGSGVNGDEAAMTGFERDVWIANSAGQWNGGGFMYSNDYGFGLVDAGAAVRLAQAWFLPGGSAQTSANDEVLRRDMLDQTETVPDADTTGLEVSTTIGASGESFEIDYSTVTITMDHNWMGDVSIVLVNDAGDTAVLYNREAEFSDGFNFGSVAYPGEWTFTTRQFHGEDAAGNWRVRIIDSAAGDVGVVSDVVLRHHGDENRTNDRHFVTDQFSTFASESGRRTITDTDGGRDTLYAAALSTGAMIELDGTVNSRIDGTSVKVSASIENIIGGRGKDDFVGSDKGNYLSGMDGNDTLAGRSGNDTVRGNNGDDYIYGGTGNDDLRGGAGKDSFIFTSAVGSANADVIVDFSEVSDRIRLDNADFAGLSTGTLAASKFQANTAGQATQSNDRIIYDTNGGQIYFDRDGSGNASRQLFATITTDGITLTASDFIIF